MTVSVAVLSGATSTRGKNVHCASMLSKTFWYLAVVFLFVINTFATGWLCMNKLHPAEVTNLRIRI